MRRPSVCTAAIGLITSSFFVACGDDHDDAGTVTIHFDHQIAGHPLDVDPMASYANAAGNAYTVSMLKYIVSDLDLIRHDGATHRLRLGLGLRLPTGSTDIRNRGGNLAEPTLQPGTGALGLVVDAGYDDRAAVAGKELRWFVSSL